MNWPFFGSFAGATPEDRKSQRIHKMFVHNFGAPPSPNSKVVDFLLNFHYKALKQNCEHSAKTANKPSQNCEQTELWTNGHFWSELIGSGPLPKSRTSFWIFGVLAEENFSEFSFCSFRGLPKGWFSERVVLAHVPPERKPERGYIRMFPRERKPERGYVRMFPWNEKPERGHIHQNHAFGKPSRSWNSQARLKISSEPPTKPPIFCGEFWRSRLKFSSDIEISSEIDNFKRDCFFPRFGPLGFGNPRNSFSEFAGF